MEVSLRSLAVLVGALCFGCGTSSPGAVDGRSCAQGPVALAGPSQRPLAVLANTFGGSLHLAWVTLDADGKGRLWYAALDPALGALRAAPRMLREDLGTYSGTPTRLRPVAVLPAPDGVSVLAQLDRSKFPSAAWYRLRADGSPLAAPVAIDHNLVAVRASGAAVEALAPVVGGSGLQLVRATPDGAVVSVRSAAMGLFATPTQQRDGQFYQVRTSFEGVQRIGLYRIEVDRDPLVETQVASFALDRSYYGWTVSSGGASAALTAEAPFGGGRRDLAMQRFDRAGAPVGERVTVAVEMLQSAAVFPREGGFTLLTLQLPAAQGAMQLYRLGAGEGPLSPPTALANPEGFHPEQVFFAGEDSAAGRHLVVWSALQLGDGGLPLGGQLLLGCPLFAR